MGDGIVPPVTVEQLVEAFARMQGSYGFVSGIAIRVGTAVPVWSLTTIPARTSGNVTTVYNAMFYNPGLATRAWLEVAGVAITVPIVLGATANAFVPFEGGLTVGDNDVNLNSIGNEVQCVISGTEV